MSVIRTCTVRNQTIQLDLDTDQESEDGVRNYELWRAGHYDNKEPDTLDWIDTHLHEGDTLYDIGANIGQYSLYAAKCLNGNAHILTFEPEALNFAKLNRNIVLNGLGQTMTAYPLALSDKTAIDHFYSKAFKTGAALHALGRPITQGEKAFDPQNRQGIMAVSLDDLTGKFGLPFPTHIKVDVDGIEDRIVTGAHNTLRDPRLKSFLIEVYMHGNMAGNIVAAFEDAGFTLSNRDQISFTPGVVHNLIFVRE
ncbi:MAG: FkbM family methyltransferase [bacterium]|jgi:FkbM family methyltransferase|nr:FkbM family methyltransferase [bacterium]